MSEFMSLAAAVAEHVRDGDTVAMEGFTHLIPHAAGHEVIRQRRKHLTAVRMTPDLIYDQLIGMGCVDKVVFSWCGNPGVGSLHRMRDAIENAWPQPLAYEEHSHAAMANAYEAGAAGLPFAVHQHVAGAIAHQHGNRAMLQTAPMHFDLRRDTLRDVVRVDEDDRVVIVRSGGELVQYRGPNTACPSAI